MGKIKKLNFSDLKKDVNEYLGPEDTDRLIKRLEFLIKYEKQI